MSDKIKIVLLLTVASISIGLGIALVLKFHTWPHAPFVMTLLFGFAVGMAYCADCIRERLRK